MSESGNTSTRVAKRDHVTCIGQYLSITVKGSIIANIHMVLNK